MSAGPGESRGLSFCQAYRNYAGWTVRVGDGPGGGRRSAARVRSAFGNVSWPTVVDSDVQSYIVASPGGELGIAVVAIAS